MSVVTMMLDLFALGELRVSARRPPARRPGSRSPEPPALQASRASRASRLVVASRCVVLGRRRLLGDRGLGVLIPRVFVDHEEEDHQRDDDSRERDQCWDFSVLHGPRVYGASSYANLKDRRAESAPIAPSRDGTSRSCPQRRRTRRRRRSRSRAGCRGRSRARDRRAALATLGSDPIIPAVQPVRFWGQTPAPG